MMTFHVKPLRRTVLALLLCACAGSAVRAADPDPQLILRNTRMAQTGQQRTLEGHLRVQSTGQIIPFSLVLSGESIRYEFQDKTIRLHMGANSSQLLEAAHGDTRKVSPARYDQAVEGTDLTYEDLSLKFLYWPTAHILGSETVDALNCWKLDLQPGDQPSAYASVLLWVSKRTGTFLQGEGYNTTNQLVKRFKVVSGQQDPGGGWILKKMRIETLTPGKPESITYLEIDK